MDDSRGTPAASPPPRDYSAELVAAILRALPGWVDRTIRTRLGGQPRGLDESLDSTIGATSVRMVEGVRTSLTELLARDPEQQRANPLQVLREEAAVVTECLRGLGAEPVARDEFDRTSLPGDVFGIGPLTWRDMGDEVHEAGITWGAWKAATVMSRHRADGSDR